MLNIPKIDFKYKTYLVGGAVRDSLIDPDSKPKDIDLCMVCESMEQVESEVKRVGGEIFISKPEYLTVRCKLPELGAVDIAIARKDGNYTDGRRPDSVEITSDIRDDLSRRDFTSGAIAVDIKTGEVVDPFNGTMDIKCRILKCVGNSEDRFEEDFLRLLRSVRFAVTKGFVLNSAISKCLHDRYFCCNLRDKVSQERIREELYKCFKHDTWRTLILLEEYKTLRNALFGNKEKSLWLKPTSEEK